MNPALAAISHSPMRGPAGAKGKKTLHGQRKEPGAVAVMERNRLLVELLPQVRYIARRIHDRLPSRVPFDDIYHTGVLGLIDALKKYDPRKKVQIQSYMKFRIRGAILDGLRELDWGPRELRKKARQIERAEHALRSRLGRNPSETEIAAELRVSLLHLQRLLGELRGLDLCSLQDVVTTSADGVEQELGGRLAGPREVEPYELCTRTERKEQLARAVEQLPEKERQVLALYYFQELTMKEIGGLLSVGESRVSQIHTLAMVRLRSLLRPQEALPGGEGEVEDLIPPASHDFCEGVSRPKGKHRPLEVPA